MAYTTLEPKFKAGELTDLTAANPHCIVNGRADIAYEEIAEARANCIKAAYTGNISEAELNFALARFIADMKKIGKIGPTELEKLITTYAEQNKQLVYTFDSMRIVC